MSTVKTIQNNIQQMRQQHYQHSMITIFISVLLVGIGMWFLYTGVSEVNSKMIFSLSYGLGVSFLLLYVIFSWFKKAITITLCIFCVSLSVQLFTYNIYENRYMKEEALENKKKEVEQLQVLNQRFEKLSINVEEQKKAFEIYKANEEYKDKLRLEERFEELERLEKLLGQ